MQNIQGRCLNFIKNGLDYIQAIPCLPPFDSVTSEAYSLTPRLYASFLKELFMIWERELNAGYCISIRLFDNITRMLTGQPPGQCGMLSNCHSQFVVGSDGSVYPCDFYVLDKYRAGYIKDSTFSEIAMSEQMQSFLQNDKQTVSPLCADCKVHELCRGGCKRYRELYFSEGNYCPYQDFLYNTYEGFRAIAARVP